MKKLLLTFLTFFATAQLSYCQFLQMVSATPTSQWERIDAKWTYTAPITFNYCVLYSFSGGFFAGGGVGVGADLNGGGTGNINLDIPAIGYLGFQVQGLPAFSIGAGGNLSSKNPILAFGIHFTSLNIGPATAKYTPLLTNEDYRKTRIGFRKDE